MCNISNLFDSMAIYNLSTILTWFSLVVYKSAVIGPQVGWYLLETKYICMTCAMCVFLCPFFINTVISDGIKQKRPCIK